MKLKTKKIIRNLILFILIMCLSLVFFSCSVTFSNTKAEEAQLTALSDYNIFAAGKIKLFSVTASQQIEVDPEQNLISIENVTYRNWNLNQAYDMGPVVMPNSDTYFLLADSITSSFNDLIFVIHYGYMLNQNIGYNTIICFVSDISQMLNNNRLFWIDLLNGVNVDNAFKSDYDNAYCFDLISINVYRDETEDAFFDYKFSPFLYFESVITKNTTPTAYYAVPYKGYYKEPDENFFYKCKNIMIYSNYYITSASLISSYNMGSYIPFYPLTYKVDTSEMNNGPAIVASFGDLNYYIGEYGLADTDIWEFSGTGTTFSFTTSAGTKWGNDSATSFAKNNISQLIEIQEGGTFDIPDTTRTKFRNTFKIILYCLFPAALFMQVVVGAVIAINSNITWGAGIKQAMEIFDKAIDNSIVVIEEITDNISKAVAEIPHWTKTFKTGLTIVLIAVLTFFVLYIALMIYKNRR